MRKKFLKMTRRQILKAGLVGGAGLMLPWKFRMPKAWAQIPGGTLPPGDVNKFVQPLIKPPAMPASKILTNNNLYRIAVRQFKQRILSPPHPETTVWSYGSVDFPGTVAQGGTFNYPAFTIEAGWNRKVSVEWRNELVDATGNYLPHLLPVDPTLHPIVAKI
jgi:spore coat protein A, manganese oxidase